MGGRCSALQNVMGSLLQIKPMIYMQPDGALGVKKKIRGNREKGLQALLDEVRADADRIDTPASLCQGITVTMIMRISLMKCENFCRYVNFSPPPTGLSFHRIAASGPSVFTMY
jgi:hypothetical protein